MTYEDYQVKGFKAVDYYSLSQWQRFRGIILDWKKSKYKKIGFAALWDKTDESIDWVRVDDWWNIKHWRFGIWQCQEFHHIDFGPIALLIAT